MQLTIEKLIYGGDGLARLVQPEEAAEVRKEVRKKDPRGKAVFVPFVLPGEQVEARAVEEKSGFMRAALEKILTPSPQRIAPLCPYFQHCGGCHYQHTEYTNQLAIKRQILDETLERTAKIKWDGETHLHPSPPWGYRNRTRMRITAEPFALGYHRHSSHVLLPVESCPISSPLINRAIAAIWEIGRGGGFVGYPLSEIEFFAGHADAKLLLELYAEKPMPEQDWQKLAESLRARVPAITSLSVLSRAKHTRPEMQCEASVKVEYSLQPEAFIYEAGPARYQVSPGSFFQTNRFLVKPMVEIVCAGAKGKLALDLFAGVGLFSAPLAKTFDRVEAIEIAPSSFNDLRKNVPRNVRVHCVTTAEYLKTAPLPANLDLVVVDPPRAGLGTDVSRKLAAAAPARVTYVSCDPATLARDLAVFLQSGYAIEQMHLLDLFPQTFHIETVAHLSRKRPA